MSKLRPMSLQSQSKLRPMSAQSWLHLWVNVQTKLVTSPVVCPHKVGYTSGPMSAQSQFMSKLRLISA